MTSQSKFYKIEGDTIDRTHRTCPKCGDGYYLGEHYDRYVCGKCHYTIFKRKGNAPARTKGTGKGRSPRRRVRSQQ